MVVHGVRVCDGVREIRRSYSKRRDDSSMKQIEGRRRPDAHYVPPVLMQMALEGSSRKPSHNVHSAIIDLIIAKPCPLHPRPCCCEARY